MPYPSKRRSLPQQQHPQQETGLPQHYRPTHTPNFTPPPGSSPQRGYNLFVGTLPAGTTRDDLETVFSPFGGLTDTYMLKQEGLGGRRCGFVSFSTYLSAALAISILNGFVIWPGELGICVRFANPVKQPPGAELKPAVLPVATAAAIPPARAPLGGLLPMSPALLLAAPQQGIPLAASSPGRDIATATPLPAASPSPSRSADCSRVASPIAAAPISPQSSGSKGESTPAGSERSEAATASVVNPDSFGRRYDDSDDAVCLPPPLQDCSMP